MGSKGRLIIVAAPSGTGKTTLIRRLLEDHPEVMHSVSCTTRPPRPGDVEGRDYVFLAEGSFRGMIRRGDLAEWASVHGHLYGTPKEPVERWLAEGRDVLLDLDVVGSLSLKRAYGDRAVSIFLAPPTMEELKKRLAGRGTDSPEAQKLRLENARAELSQSGRFDHQVVNDSLDRACGEIEKILWHL